jgi:tetratricopeptide (TPR) repeat protein
MGKLLGRRHKSYETASEPNHFVSYDDDSEFQKRHLYQKGVNQMASERLEDAIRSFDLALRIDPKYVDSWIKKGYAHFHLGQYAVAISSYDKALDIDISNGEAWNMKGLAYYKMSNYDKAIESCDKAIDVNPNDGMSWYNKACYLTVIGKADEGMEALKRSIEIDITYAKRAVRDRDFENAKAEEGFRRIIEVVVLESIRQGYNYVGKIVWVTGMDKTEVEDAIMRLSLKGLVIRKEKKEIHGFFTSKEEYYELVKEIAEKVGVSKRIGFLGRTKEISAPVQQIRDILEVLGRAKESVEIGDVASTIECFDQLINPAKHGTAMIEQFFDQHRDLRMFQIRLKDKGFEYLNSHKPDLLMLLADMEANMRTSPVSRSAEDGS